MIFLTLILVFSVSSGVVQIESAAVRFVSELEVAADLLRSELYRRSHLEIEEILGTGPMGGNNLTDWDILIYLIDGDKKRNEIVCETDLTQLTEEGYMIFFDDSSSSTKHLLCVIGSGKNGVIFGVGRLLRELTMSFSQEYCSLETTSTVIIDSNVNIVSSPKFKMRGHMLSYRSISNCYDGFTLNDFEQYVKDLVVFGTNQIEMVGFDEKNSPNFHMTQIEFIAKASEIIDKYGLNMSIWDPITDEVFVKEEVLRNVKRLNSYFIPSGDPGSLSPTDFFSAVSNKSKIIHKYFPDCEIWISHQSFNASELEEYSSILYNSKDLGWLTGIVYGPHSRWTIEYAREVGIPSKFPLRHYPDIGHGMKSEFPNPFWTTSYAFTQAREAINPRPLQMENIIRLTQDYTIGFSSYSDGCNDDLNKFIWSQLHWEDVDEVSSKDVVYDYSKYFFGYSVSDPVDYEYFLNLLVECILELEQNWVVDSNNNNNNNPYETYKKFEFLDTHYTSVSLKKNWRFQTLMYRSAYDAYQYLRNIAEKGSEEEALMILELGLEGEMSIDESVLLANLTLQQQNEVSDTTDDLLSKIQYYAGLLYQSVNMEVSVTEYFASSIGRGATLDTVNVPLNNRRYLFRQFNYILNDLKTYEEKEREVRMIVDWRDVPSERGGYYVCPGELKYQPQNVIEYGTGYEYDPSFYSSYLMGFQEPFDVSEVPVYPFTWYSYGEGMYDYPVRMNFDPVDCDAKKYRLRVVYGGDSFSTKIRCDANGYQVHDYIQKPNPLKILEFGIPQSYYTPSENYILKEECKLMIEWSVVPGGGGNGRGNQISEVWLVPELD